MKAVILAAGLGKRMAPITHRIAKPAMPLFGRPLIVHLIMQLQRAGVSEFYVNLHHMPHTIRSSLRRLRPLRIQFSFEESILGTAGALYPWRDQLRDDHFIIVNGDIVTDVDFEIMIARHRKLGADATLALHPGSSERGFPVIGADESGRITRFPYSIIRSGSYAWGGTFTGVQIVSFRYLDFIHSRRFLTSTESVYPEMIQKGYNLQAYCHAGYWNDAGTPERYFEAHRDRMDTKKEAAELCRSEKVSVWYEDQWLFKDSSCTIAPDMQLDGIVVLGRNCVIGSGAHLRNTIVWDNIEIRERMDFENAIVFGPDESINIGHLP